MHKRKYSNKGRSSGSKRYKKGSSKYSSRSQIISGGQTGVFTRQARSEFPRSLSAFPDALVIRVRTYGTFVLVSTSGAFSPGAVKGNSLLTPFTNLGSSHESAAATQLRTNWANYRVYAARLTTNLYASDSIQDSKTYLSMGYVQCPTGINANFTSFAQAIESARSTWGTYCTSNQGECSKQWVRSSANTRAVFGVRREELIGDPNFAASTGSTDFADPASTWYFNLCWQASDGATTTQIGADMLLEQWVVFYGRRNGY